MNPATHLYKTNVLAIRTAALAAALFVTTSAPARTAHTANPKGGGNTPAQSDPDILRRASLKETSLCKLARRLGLEPEAFVRHFIEYERMVRRHDEQ